MPKISTAETDAIFISGLKLSLNQEILKVAEPLIREKIKEVETELRKKLAENLVALIDTSISMESYGRDLRIILHRPEKCPSITVP